MIKHLKSTAIQRKFIKQLQIQLNVLKVILKTNNSANFIILNANLKRYLLQEINYILRKFYSTSRAKTVCLITGRTRGLYKKHFKVTRMQLREQTSNGLRVGVKKSSW